MTIDAGAVAAVLGGEKVLRHRIRSVDDLRLVVEAGLPVASLECAARRLAGEGAEAVELMHRIVPRSTLQRRGRRLNVEESQRLERMARVIALAEHVWEDPGAAREFLTSVQPHLSGERPIDLASSELGARQVETLLFRLEYSLPA
ncbi:MAG: DUF2384 domain-containing protein [Gemmatimonadetes bacterium]|nr:DUF2384 domain-containing protein [Gemmatimonadota bacterium]